MDSDTALLLILTICAYFWLVAINILEERREQKMREKAEEESRKRTKRLNKLYGRT